jgi:squalene-hopene/tetraprenyl-beta-curcumene cyclase
VPPTSRTIQRATRWLIDHQNEDGGWGEDMRSYTDKHWHGRGESTPSQTAWALLALHAAGFSAAHECVEGGLRWLVERQHDDGSWDEPVFTGTGFPGDFYMGYPLYRQIFPTIALARYAEPGQLSNVISK